MLPRLDALLQKHVPASVADASGDADMDGGDSNNSSDAMVCWTVATSIKLAVGNKVDAAQFAPFMPNLLTLLHHRDVAVRNSALLVVFAAVHHMPQTVAPLFKDSILPALYEVYKLKMERKVDFGPFTHTVDDALPLRKAALSIFASTMEYLPPSSVDVPAFMPVLAFALRDSEDIQLHAHQIIVSMSQRPQQQHRQPSGGHHHSQQQQHHFVVCLAQASDSFVEPLEKTLNKKQGQRTGTELERWNEWIKSALRAVVALSKLEGLPLKFTDFFERTKQNPKFTQQLKAISME